jgi:hypothetical protein
MSRLPTRPRALVRAHVCARLTPLAGGLARRLRAEADAGMTTAEYAVGTVAACGFAALLWTVLHSAAVQQALSALVLRALGML